jgi:hypothetical protein
MEFLKVGKSQKKFVEFSILPKKRTKLTILSIYAKEKMLMIVSFGHFLEELRTT